MRDVLVGTASGICLTERDIFLESYGSLLKWFKWATPVELSLPPTPRMPGDGPVTCLVATGYYHFILEELPRLLWALQQYPELRVIICHDAPQFYHAAVDCLRQSGVLRGPVEFHPRILAQVGDYVFTAAEEFSGFVHSADVALVKEWGRMLPGIPDESTPEQIYISRRKVGTRSFMNEEAVEDLLRNMGITVVYLEDLDFSRQVGLFRRVNLVVAAHGAGLANLVWCAQPATVVEIFPANFINDCYARLASTLGYAYHPLWAASTGGAGSVDLQELRTVVGNFTAQVSVKPGQD